MGGLVRTKVLVSACLLIVTFASAQQPVAARKIAFSKVIDLTHTLNQSTPVYEETKESPYKAKTVATFEKEHYFAREICLPEHFGTHLDAPAHFARGSWTLDQIPAERLVAPLYVIDVSNNVKSNPDYQLSAADVTNWEDQHGRIAPASVVIVRTGWNSRWNSSQSYRNADPKGTMHFPGYSLAAAKLLVARGVFGLGIDTLSIDYGPSADFPVHQYTLAHKLYHLENVANLENVPAVGATIIAAPMKLEGGSGSPVRIFALVP
jgi:kynurenine formamidase